MIYFLINFYNSFNSLNILSPSLKQKKVAKFILHMGFLKVEVDEAYTHIRQQKTIK